MEVDILRSLDPLLQWSVCSGSQRGSVGSSALFDHQGSSRGDGLAIPYGNLPVQLYSSSRSLL